MSIGVSRILLTCQTCRNVTLEDVAVFGEFCPSGRDSSLNHLVLAFVSGAISLSQVGGAFNVLDLGIVDIYLCVSFHHHFCLRLVHLQILVFTFIT